MLRCMLRAKIHLATVTSTKLEYNGSVTIDSSLLKSADIRPYEQVLVSNLNNGERFETYVIPGRKGEVCLNGPTARKGQKGDRIILFSYCWIEDEKTKNFKPKILVMDSNNRIVKS